MVRQNKFHSKETENVQTNQETKAAEALLGTNVARTDVGEIGRTTADQVAGRERAGVVSEDEAAGRRDMDDFRTRRNQGLVEAEQNFWDSVIYSPEFCVNSDFQDVAEWAKALGIDHVIPVLTEL